MNHPHASIRRKFIFATLTPLCVAILLSWLIGFQLITDHVFRQAQQNMIQGLNLARTVYRDEINHLDSVVKGAALMPELVQRLGDSRFERSEKVLLQILQTENLSFLNLIDAKGVVHYRAANQQQHGDRLEDDPILDRALNGELTGGVQIYSQERLRLENPVLAQTAQIALTPTPRARIITRNREPRGLMLVAAAPLLTSDGRVVGALQAGFMLNGDSMVVDTITRIVFGQDGKGAATIFLGDVRIATNVRDTSGDRAIGSLMSEDVARVVLKQGENWSDRAFVYRNWYISAYEPIRDPSGSVVGALYVGMPEQPLLDLKKRLNLIFAGVLLSVALIGISLATWISSRMARPVRALAEATRRMASGQHIEPITVTSNDEIGLLANEFNKMTREVSLLNQTLEQKVAERTRDLAEKNAQLLATQNELCRAERLASLGMLAAGVAHEINNPLAVIRGNAELLQSAIPAGNENREEADAIVEEAIRIERIVNNLRVFSRNGIKRVSSFSLGKMLDTILNQIGHQIPLDRYRIMKNYREMDVDIEGDKDQLRQVFTNLIINGLQAMPEGGELVMSAETDQRVRVMVQDKGCGIQDEDKERLFSPFFSTKAQGTGLGLAVSYSIVRDHGGEIRVESRVGEGTTFTVVLPLRQEPVDRTV
ncbi:cache domain-containing protein [Geobacter sp. AOG2]|uniref:cache domain-containing protein n=1 Tax=Geobacter sp. AOG2 TaxID=1566347 RepID=UPI001CC527AD|nr:cache domain-containing protein [Geobacter sp. AOG2]GFE60471.1 two-component sensor histidine kinase [Geobacter sp. AOG2]